MSNVEKQKQHVSVKIVKYEEPAPIHKSDKSEQVSQESAMNASEWIAKRHSMHGLKQLVEESAILPQCIRAYKNNIAGFGINVRYKVDYDEESEEMIAEFNQLTQIIKLLNMDMMTKEVFEMIINDRETYGISYCEVIRELTGDVSQLEFITDTPSVEMTCPLEPYVDIEYYQDGAQISRKKRFRKFKQTIGSQTIYFKEFGDPRVMDKHNGNYVGDEDIQTVDIDNQANEILCFKLGSATYGEIRWIGQVLTADGSRKAEKLNNNYFSKGRHTPLMIIVKGGTLSDESFTKLQSYMSDIQGESGQHSFMVLETDSNETSAAFSATEKPEIEIKDLASMLQKDELFQEYQENSRKKIQSSFLLPDLYTAYTTDFNRATAQTAMEVTEKQVFQPERASLSWIINNKLLNAYNFKYVEAYFEEPDTTNPDDIYKLLNIAEKAGGVTPNIAKELTYTTLGKDNVEDYEGDWGDTPLQYLKSMVKNVDTAIEKAKKSSEDEDIIDVMKQIKKALLKKEGE